MSLQRKIKAIQLVQQIKQQEIEGYAVRLSSIRAQQNELSEEIENLVRMRDREGKADIPEAALYLASFLRAIRRRNAYLNEKFSKLDSAAEEIEMQLQSAFVEKKTTESAMNRTIKELNLKRSQAETAASEEMARNSFLRSRVRASNKP